MRILLYAPSLAGHPQVYCRVIGDILLEAGHEISIAAPAERGDWQSRWSALRPFVRDGRVYCLDVRAVTGSAEKSPTAEQLIQIQKKCCADATLLTHADAFTAQFGRIAAREAPRLRGRTCAIFAHTSKWYPGEDAYSGKSEPLWGPTLRNTIGRMKKMLFDRRKSDRYYFEHELLRRRAVDALIVKDERINMRYGPPVYWMPEIYRVFDIRPEERRGPDWDRFADPIHRYIERARPDNVLLFFGSAAWYKGYDIFLKLAQSDPTIFALHAGLTQSGDFDRRYEEDPEILRQALIREGRLFETASFVESADLVSRLFGDIARFVSTHRLTLSSGTMLQALEMGKPVLVPDAGLVGWRTREFKLGGTYSCGDPVDLAAKWSAFKTGAFDADAQGIRSFMARFSRERTKQFFLDVLTGGGA